MRWLFLFFLLAAPGVRAEEFSFQASSLETPFAVVGDISGTMEVESDVVKVTIANGHLERRACGITKNRSIKQLSAFLATLPEDRRSFTSLVLSPPLPIGKVTAVGEKVPLEGTQFEIQTGSLTTEQIQKAWLAFSIIDEHPGEDGKPRGGTCYIHAANFLSGAPSGFPLKYEKTASGDLKILEAALAPLLAGLNPKASLFFLPEENTVHADFRTKYYKLSDPVPIAGGGYLFGRGKRGPDEQGFMLTVHLQDAGAAASKIGVSEPLDQPNWTTDSGVSPVAGTPKQVSWSLSYGAETDPVLLKKLKQSLQGLSISPR